MNELELLQKIADVQFVHTITLALILGAVLAIAFYIKNN